MVRTIRASKRNPIERSAAQEMFDYVSEEGGRLLVEWETDSGKKVRAIAHLTTGPIVANGREVITIDRLVRPDGAVVSAWEGKSFIVPIEKIRTLGYVGEEEESEGITEAKFQYRFLNPEFRSAFKYNEKDYPTLEAALIAAAVSPEAIKRGDIAEGELPGPAFIRAGWFTPGVRPPQPSDATLNTVLQIVNARFSDPMMRRMLVSTGDRPFALPGEAGGSFLGVDLNDIYTRVRRVAVDSGVQPTGKLKSRFTVPTAPAEAAFSSQEAKEFLKESREAYAELEKKFSRQLEKQQDEAPFAFVDVDTRLIYTNEPQPYQAMIYVSTIERDRVADTLNTRDIQGKLPFGLKIINQPKNPLDVGPLAADLAAWLLEHPDWEIVGLAHGIPQPTTAVFLSALKARMTSQGTLDIARARAEAGARDTDGNLLLPVGGILVGVERRATEYVLTMETEASGVALFDKTANATLLCASLSAKLNNEVVKLFPAAEAHARTMLRATGLAPVVPIRPEVEVPSTPTPPLPEGGPPEGPSEAELAEKSLSPLPGQESFAAAEDLTPPSAGIAIPSEDLTPKMSTSPHVVIRTRIRAAMEDLKQNADFILQVEDWGKRANAFLKQDDVDLLERAKVYVESLRKANTVLRGTIDKVAAFRKGLIQCRDVLRRVDSVDPANSNALWGLQRMIDDINTLIEKRAIQDALEVVKETYQKRLNDDLRARSDAQMLRGLTLFAPARTPTGHYDLSGETGRLVLREELKVPASTPPVNYDLGREYQVGDVIELRDEAKIKRRRTVTETSATGILLIIQNRPVNVAPIKMQYFPFPQGRMIDTKAIAEAYNQSLLPFFRKMMAEAFDIQFGMDEAGKKNLLKEISEALTEKDPSGENYIVAAQNRRQEERKRLLAQMTEGKEELTQKEADEILTAINEKTKYSGANIVRDPVLYAILVDTVMNRVYYPEEVNLENYVRAMNYFNENEPEGAKKLKSVEMSPKFMSKFPLDAGSIDFVRTATGAERDAVLKVLMPALQEGKPAKFPLPWRPSKFRKSKQVRSDIGELREAVDAVRHFAARTAATQPGSTRGGGFGTVTVRKGSSAAGSALPGTIGKGTVTGKGVLEAGSQYTVRMHRAKPGDEVGDFYIKGDLSRLRRYLQELADSQQKLGGLRTVDRKDLELMRSRILKPYRTVIGYDVPVRKPGEKGPLPQIPVYKTYKEAEADFRYDTEAMQGLKDQLDLLDATTLARLRSEGGEFVDETGATQHVTASEVESALNAAQDLANLNAVQAEIARRGEEVIEAEWRRRQSAAPLIDQYVLKYRKMPSKEELILLEALALEGINPFDGEPPSKANSMRYHNKRNPTRRNAGEPSEFSDEDLEAASAVTPGPTKPAAEPPPAAGGSAPPPRPPPPPRREEEEPEEPEEPRRTGTQAQSEAQARALEASTRRREGTMGALSPLSRTVDYSQTRVDDLRNQTAEAWATFNDTLNDSRATEATLRPLLNAYLEVASLLQSALDERDRQFLVKNGPEALRELLRSEALEALAHAQAPYNRASKAVGERSKDKKMSARARLVGARAAANKIDPYGRPLVPPSPEKLEQRGLAPFDLATARAKELKDGFLNLPTPINYAQLIEAAKIAAEAEKRREQGISVGAVSCRVMGEEGGIRNKIDRELTVRMFNPKVYKGGPRGGAPQPNASQVNWDKIMIVWLSPSSDHAIVYVNNIGVCEFHSDQYPVLMASLIRYISDWFSDPRHSVQRADYSVFIGRSGFDRLYQIWGRWPAVEGRAATAPDTGRPTPRGLFERLVALGIYNESKEKEFVPLGKLEVRTWLRGMTFYWITETSAVGMGFGSLREYLTAEAEAYREALAASSYAKPATESYAILQAGDKGERARHAAAVSQDVMDAMEGTRKAVTLFYPELYNREGENLSANSNTPLDISKHLQAVAAAVPDGGLVRIVDLSLFRSDTRFSIMSAPKTRAVASIRGSLKGIVPTPYRALAEMMRGKTEAEIEVVIPMDTDIKADLPSFFPEYEDLPVIKPIFLSSGYGIAALGEKNAIAPGSTLILWNDPDVPGDDRQFGRASGSRLMADVLAQHLGFIKRIYVETGNTQVEAKLSKDAATDRERIEAALSRMDETTAFLIRAVYFQKRSRVELAQELRAEGAEAVLPDGRVVPVRKENIDEVIEDGLEEMKRLMTEAGQAEPERFVEKPLVDLDELRANIIDALSASLKSAGTDKTLLIAALGVPMSVRETLKARVGFNDPVATATELVNEIARAYQVDPALYISQGTRGSGSILLNRGLRSNVSRRTKIYGTQGRR